MAPKKGSTNNPNGSKPDKLITDAIRLALNHEAKGADGKPTKKLFILAEKLVDKAADGDIQAIREVLDRLEGKAHQSIEHSGDMAPAYVARMPVKAETTEQWQQQYAPTIQ